MARAFGQLVSDCFQPFGNGVVTTENGQWKMKNGQRKCNLSPWTIEDKPRYDSPRTPRISGQLVDCLFSFQ